MYIYTKKPKPVDTKFVLEELDKIKRGFETLDKRADFLYAMVLYEEVKTIIKSFKTISIGKIQRKFHLGWVRSAHLFDRLEREGLVVRSKKGKNLGTYIINRK